MLGSARLGAGKTGFILRAFLLAGRQLSCFILTQWREEVLVSLSLLIKTLIPLWGLYTLTPSKPNYPPRLCLLMSPHWGIRVSSSHELDGNKHSVRNNWPNT